MGDEDNELTDVTVEEQETTPPDESPEVSEPIVVLGPGAKADPEPEVIA